MAAALSLLSSFHYNMKEALAPTTCKEEALAPTTCVLFVRGSCCVLLAFLSALQPSQLCACGRVVVRCLVKTVGWNYWVALLV